MLLDINVETGEIRNVCSSDGVNKFSSSKTSFPSIRLVLTQTFLPIGYPHSVREEYLTYQMYDSIQGVSSYLRSVLTTKMLLTGVGVGDVNASAASAALAWVYKDGVSMMGSLVFAYYCSDLFETNLKEWRLMADVLNNVGLTLDMLIGTFPSHFLLISSLSGLSKACCGLVAGATKARISNHFALKGHLSDVVAKESTQETAIALIGMMLGLICSKLLLGCGDMITWIVFLLLLILHQWSNYRLVFVLVLDTFNPQRVWLLANSITINVPVHDAQDGGSTGSSKQSVPTPCCPTPADLAALESLYRPIWMYWHGPLMGGPVKDLLEGLSTVSTSGSGSGGLSRSYSWERLRRAWGDEGFIVGLE